MLIQYYFKLDPNIRNKTEVNFARMELEGILRKDVNPIKHFYDAMIKPPLSMFKSDEIRIQDYLLNPRTVYGNIQGYFFENKIFDLTPLIQRLAYTREIYVSGELPSDSNIEDIRKRIYPTGYVDKNYQNWCVTNAGHNYFLFRIITNQFFLEQLNNVILCSVGRTKEEQIRRVDENINRLFIHIIQKIREYIPKFPKDYNWKEFEDFIDEPKEITLYLTQFYGPPYKAKFHPRMIRALINYSTPLLENRSNCTIGDFFLGSGTLAIESVLQNIHTIGSDINPLSEIVTRAKIDALSFEPKNLLLEIDKIQRSTFEAIPMNLEFISKVEGIIKNKSIVIQAIKLREYIETKIATEYKDFFKCALASTISYCSKKRNNTELFEVFKLELWNMWKLIYAFDKIKKYIHIRLGKAEIRTDDVRTLDSVKNNSIDLIITSPPYSTAIDYVSLDLPQLILLKLIDNQKELDDNMIGTTRRTSSYKELVNHITDSKLLIPGNNENLFLKLPADARKYILELKEQERIDTSLRCYKFLIDMWKSLKQMHRVLLPGGGCIIIIGNNTFRIGHKRREFKNGDFIQEMALYNEIGFELWRDKIIREYSKSSYGTILKEDIIFLRKPHNER